MPLDDRKGTVRQMKGKEQPVRRIFFEKKQQVGEGHALGRLNCPKQCEVLVMDCLCVVGLSSGIVG